MNDQVQTFLSFAPLEVRLFLVISMPWSANIYIHSLKYIT